MFIVCYWISSLRLSLNRTLLFIICQKLLAYHPSEREVVLIKKLIVQGMVTEARCLTSRWSFLEYFPVDWLLIFPILREQNCPYLSSSLFRYSDPKTTHWRFFQHPVHFFANSPWFINYTDLTSISHLSI